MTFKPSDDRVERLWSVYERGSCCAYCGRALPAQHMRLVHEEGAKPHVVCQDCHEDKGDRTSAEYRHVRRLRQAQQMLASLGQRS